MKQERLGLEVRAIALLRAVGAVRGSWPDQTKLFGASSIPQTTAALYVQVRTVDAFGIWGPVCEEVGALLPMAARALDPTTTEVSRVAGGLVARWRHAHAGVGSLTAAAVELACWDAVGRRDGMGLAELLPTGNNSAPAYASLIGLGRLDRPPEGLPTQIRELGYRVQKWRLPSGPNGGDEGLAANVAFVAAVAREVGVKAIAVECDGGWTGDYLHRFADVCPGPLAWIEEPVPPWDEPVGASVNGHPIGSGEHSYSPEGLAASQGAVCLPDVTFVAGVMRVLTAIVEANRAGRRCAMHGNGLAMATAIATRLGESCLVEHHLTLEPRRQGLARQPAMPRDGRVGVPPGPGLGASPREDCDVVELGTWEVS